MNFELDTYDRKILALMQEDARISYSELGRRIHLTSPAVAERVRRLEEQGVIRGYGVQLNLRKLGYSFEALIQVTVRSHAELDSWAESHPEVLAVHATTGTYCALLHVALCSPEHLQAILKALGELGTSTTSVVLSSQHETRQRLPADQIHYE